MFYLVDNNNLIVGVDAEWDTTAAGHSDGQGPMSDKIIGRPLDDFLSGDATRMFVRAALEAARLKGATRTLPYRCDTSTHKLHFEMIISPLADGHIRVGHELVSSELRTPKTPKHKVDSPKNMGWRCSQCLSVRWIGQSEWLATEAAENHLLVQDVCPTCASRLFTSAQVHKP